jgi:hypothetical protein
MASIVLPAEFRVGKKKVRVQALLDTGAEVTMLSLAQGKKIGATRAGRIFIRGAGGHATVREGSVDSVEIPGTGCRVSRMRIILFDKKIFPAGGLTGVSAIIGLDFMQRARMQIDTFSRTLVARCMK